MSRGNKPLKGPMGDKFSNCPLHQAYLQLFMSALMIRQGHEINIENLWVLQVKMDGVQSYEIPREFREKSEQIYDYFKNWVKPNLTADTNRK